MQQGKLSAGAAGYIAASQIVDLLGAPTDAGREIDNYLEVAYMEANTESEYAMVREQILNAEERRERVRR